MFKAFTVLVIPLCHAFDLPHDWRDLSQIDAPQNLNIDYNFCRRHVGGYDWHIHFGFDWHGNLAWTQSPDNEENQLKEEYFDLMRACVKNRGAILKKLDPVHSQNYELTGHHYPVISSRGFMGTNYISPFSDYLVSNELRNRGTYSLQELNLMLKYVQVGSIVIEIGANVGSYTSYLAIALGEGGLVLAYEPFRVLYQILTANIAINGLTNAYTFQLGLSDRKDNFVVASPDLNMIHNFGKSSITGGTLPILQEHKNASLNSKIHEKNSSVQEKMARQELIMTDTLDNHFYNVTKHLRYIYSASSSNQNNNHEDNQNILNYNYNKKVSLIKLDAENAGEKVLVGARKLILEHLPVILVEWHEPPNLLLNMGYKCSNDERFMQLHELFLCLPPRPIP